MLILFWISYNLMKEEGVVKGTLLTLAASCAVLAILQALGILDNVTSHGRVTVLRQNPNTLASVLSLGLLALVGLAYGRTEVDRKVRFLAWVLFGLLASSILSTGSRGPMVALIGGLAFFMLGGRSFGRKYKVGLVVILAVGSLVLASYQNQVVRERWEETFYEGSLSKRERIFPEAWAMFLERPFFGWGTEYNVRELGRRMGGHRTDTHNSYLWALTETGLVGAIPFLTALWICWRAAWRARAGPQGVLPIALLVCLLLINMSGTYIVRKLFWVVLAYALASNTHSPSDRRGHRSPPVTHAGLHGMPLWFPRPEKLPAGVTQQYGPPIQ